MRWRRLILVCISFILLMIMPLLTGNLPASRFYALIKLAIIAIYIFLLYILSCWATRVIGEFPYTVLARKRSARPMRPGGFEVVSVGDPQSSQIP
ncbi:MAG: hypothetical protein MI923_01440 [Phycisphaerales bacterium]|nr:hypothetical protein [Phycisphaerales bacterium]